MSNVFIALQANDTTVGLIDAILADNPTAEIDVQPAMVKINCPDKLTIKRETIEEELGRDFDLQELQVHLISLSGHVDQDDDEFSLMWNS